MTQAQLTGDLWRQQNLEILEMAAQQAATARTAIEANMVHALLRRFAEVEIARLEAKRREMKRQAMVVGT